MAKKARKPVRRPVMNKNVEIVYEFGGASDVPPLNEHAQTLLAAMQGAGEALSCHQLLQKTGVALAEWSNALALLMMHDLVRIGRCTRRGDVYWWKGLGEEQPPAKPKAKPTPAPESMPFFDSKEPVA